MMAIISAYAFLHSLESKARSVFFFLVGLTGTAITQVRGSELALLLSLVILVIGWANRSKRSAYLFITGFMASILLFVGIMGAVGGERIWSLVNRGQNLEGVKSASGRTDIWRFVIHYCMNHPQGMGYIAGFRIIFRQYFALGLQVNVQRIGNGHNSFMDILADAGWLALAIYLVIIIKIFRIGWRFTQKHTFMLLESDSASRHALRCALILLIFCLMLGMDTADFAVPLRGAFYMQNISIAIILGISAQMIAASRAYYLSKT
jgi:O-antigen ligase